MFRYLVVELDDDMAVRGTEIEEVVYDTGLVSDAVALGVDYP